ncbi:hypothetical protein FRB94_004130 [Tulasnella sp. JGI-2019a]|nr:hypothetical protein FRB94_004130 [Tulasnella sp. JGI-2019a]
MPNAGSPQKPPIVDNLLQRSSRPTSPAVKAEKTYPAVKVEPADDRMVLDEPLSPSRHPKPADVQSSPAIHASNANWGKRSHDVKPKVEAGEGGAQPLVDTSAAPPNPTSVSTPTEPRRNNTSYANPNIPGVGKTGAYERNAPRAPSGSSPFNHPKLQVHSPLDQTYHAPSPTTVASSPQQRSPVVPSPQILPKGPGPRPIVKREPPSGPRARGPPKVPAPVAEPEPAPAPMPSPKVIEIPAIANAWVPPGAQERENLEKRLRDHQRAYQTTLAVEVIKSGLDLDIALVELEASEQKWRMAESQLQRASKGFTLVEEQHAQ